jgi:hypothetical protein
MSEVSKGNDGGMYQPDDQKFANIAQTPGRYAPELGQKALAELQKPFTDDQIRELLADPKFNEQLQELYRAYKDRENE